MIPVVMSGPTFNPNRDRPAKWGVFWRDASGKKKGSWFMSETEGQTFIANVQKQAVADVVESSSDTPSAARGTVGRYLTTWLETEVKAHKEAATYRSYEQLVRLYLVPGLGSWKLADLTPPKVKQFYETLHGKGTGLATRRHVHSCLSSALTAAVFDKAIAFNPCLQLGRKIRHKDEDDLDPEPHPLTPEQAALFLDQVEAVERDWLEYFQFAHDTGCRVGEIAALKWIGKDGRSNVDLDTARVRIEAAYSPSDGKDKSPKTHQRRWVDLTDLVVSQLRDLRRRQKEQAFKDGGKPPVYVFVNGKG